MKKTVFLCTFLIAFAGFSLFAGDKEERTLLVDSFKIIVLDAQTEDPIPAAKVKIAQSELEAYTDFEGLLEINNMLVGKYDIEISFVSYQKAKFNGYLVDLETNSLIVRLNP